MEGTKIELLSTYVNELHRIYVNFCDGLLIFLVVIAIDYIPCFPTCNEVKADENTRYLLIIHYTLYPPILIIISLLRDMNINNQECVLA